MGARLLTLQISEAHLLTRFHHITNVKILNTLKTEKVATKITDVSLLRAAAGA